MEITKKVQAKYKLNLITKLTSFLLENDDIARELPKNSNFIINSKKLDKMRSGNETLIKELLKMGKKVVVVEESFKENKPWDFKILGA